MPTTKRKTKQPSAAVNKSQDSKMDYKFASFDIETARPLPPGEPDWHNYRPLGIACAALQLEGEEPQLFYRGMDREMPQGGAMGLHELLKLYQAINLAVVGGYTILTWNGLGFDFDVFQESMKPDHFQSIMNVALFFHVDMMFQFLCMKGYPLGLEAASKGMGFSGKAGGLKGDLAPLLWMEDTALLSYSKFPELSEKSAVDRRQMVLTYVAKDVGMTLQVARAVEKEGCVRWISQRGKEMSVSFPQGLLVVADALEISLPNTAWMDVPMTRERFYGWTGWKSRNG